ncbi:MAG: N-acetylmuramoyl-L-alanine amidase [Balneolales bacterium]
MFIQLSILLLSASLLINANDDNISGPDQDSLYLNVIVPDADTIQVSGTRQRVGANTNPGSRAFIDGTEVKVHSNGVFVGMVHPDMGLNTYRISVISAIGDTLHKDLLFNRALPDSTSPRDPLVIESTRMMPSEDLWLDEGDILEVRFKGSPGFEATFSLHGVINDMKMRELPPEEANGLEGIYVGRYKVRSDDRAVEAPVEFKLRKSLWSNKSIFSGAKVTITPQDFPRIVETTGTRPYLKAGNGSDRLGGAKLGYIDEGIHLKVTGKKGGVYRVKLSDSMEAWLPAYYGKLLPLETPQPNSLAGSISATGGLTGDVITVALDQRLPYITRQLNNPGRIEVDIFGARSNTNWITHHLAAKGIDNVTWEQVGSDQYRLTIKLNYDSHWGYEIGYGMGSSLRIRIKRPPVVVADDIFNGLSIALDAGHGGSNSGALGASGAEEKDITMAITRKVERLLYDKGAHVMMTRTDDIHIPMHQRVDMVKSSGAHVLVSIHANSIGAAVNPDNIKGTSTYYRGIGSQPLADIMYDNMLELGFREFGVIGSFNFSLNALTEMPNVLVETGFLSHPEEEMNLLDDNFQQRIAEKIVSGLEEYFKTHGDVQETEVEMLEVSS